MLPGSYTQIPFHQEVFVLLWRLITTNQVSLFLANFQQHVFDDFTQREDFHQKVLVGILLILDQSKKNPTKSNLMYLCIFILLSISGSRELAMSLNQ